MTRRPEPQRVPYWSLVVFAGLLALPLAWAMGILAVATIARLAWAGRGARARGRPTPGAGDAGRPTVRLGHDQRGRPVALSEAQLSVHALIVGASGAGKSTTMLRILGEQIAAHRPVVAIDLKGSPAFARALEDAAHRSGRQLRIWTPDGPSQWNPLAHGNATELKDKLIGSERFTEPHYRRAAERYVQCALQVLLATGASPRLDLVVTLMDPRRLAALARRLDGPLGEHVQEYLGSLTPDQVSGVRGLGTRLALLSESQAGPFLGPAGASPAAGSIDLRAGLAG
ncbi:MAG: FtsK/SpoIIIE domain-containing protein, partial [Solirubrobacteraceae bacterium]